MTGVVDAAFWRGKKVFLTGHTGFKGSWISLWLQSLGADIKGFSLEPPSEPSLFEEGRVAIGMQSDIGDIRDLRAITDSMQSFNPDILIHMAAQPLVRLSYRQPVETYATNVMGTVHVLEAARQCSGLRAIVNVTTDKCYENREWIWGYREDEAMGGHDPYSSSKGCAEILTTAYRKSFFNEAGSASLGSARSGNVIGGGDWAEDRLVPDILRAFESGTHAVIRYPDSIRPWQFVLEPLGGYLVLAERLWDSSDEYAQAWNFGPTYDDSRSVEWIASRLAASWGESANWRLEPDAQPHEAKYLKLDISKARERLDWRPACPLETALDQIVHWHKSWLKGEDARGLCLQQIASYMNASTEQSVMS